MECNREFKFTCRGKDYEGQLSSEHDHFFLLIKDAQSNSAWANDFSADYINQITKKTGNTKTFSVFLKLLCTSLEATHPALRVDFLSYQDIESLRSGHKLQECLSDYQVGKKYLILSYITEFEKAHYPLPLLLQEEVEYSEKDQSMDFHSNYEFLQQENSELREHLAMLSTENEMIKSEFEAFKHNSEEETNQLKHKNSMMEKELKRVKGELDVIIQQLEKKCAKDKDSQYRQEIKTLKENLLHSQNQVKYYKNKLASLQPGRGRSKERSHSPHLEENNYRVQINSPLKTQQDSPIEPQSTKSMYSPEVSIDVTELHEKIAKMQSILSKNKNKKF